MKKLVIIGAGGNSIDIIDIVEQDHPNEYKIECFLDDDSNKIGKSVQGVPIFGPIKELLDKYKNSEFCFAFAIGSPRNFYKRSVIWENFGLEEERFSSIISKRAFISKACRIGNGAIIFPGVCIHNNVKIGKFCFILANSVINHDSTIDDFTFITTGVNISSNVHVGKNTFLGVGSDIKESITIGNKVLIGASSAIVKPIEDGWVAYGNPCIPVKRVEEYLESLNQK